MSSPAKPSVEGGCFCKAIRYQLAPNARLLYNVICHCENCLSSSGSLMVCNGIYMREDFTLTSGQPSTFIDTSTGSGQPLTRSFCGTCGSSLFAVSDAVPHIISITSGTYDASHRKRWTPNKEQYIHTKAHWMPEFSLIEKEGVELRHERGPELKDLGLDA